MATKTSTRKITPEARLQAAQIQAVKDYALYRCTNGRAPKGWDIVHEAWDTEQIVEAIGKARTVVGAVNKVAAAVALMDANRHELVSA